jgi:amidohydrolase
VPFFMQVIACPVIYIMIKIAPEINISALVKLRHQLHQHPEISNQETQTALRVKQFLETTQPNLLIENIGGNGIVAVYNGKATGPTVALRCELDALPISDDIAAPYQSVNKGVGHKCGHDGHMAILLGMAQYLGAKRPKTGKAMLLFQPAEETGQGARRMLAHPKFTSLQPDYIYALHNLPGFAKGQILIKHGVFASASKGMIVRLTGATSHASHPEGGKNPALAVSQMLQSFLAIAQMHTPFNRAALITPIYMRVGQPAFGTSAGDGELMVTLRAHHDEEMDVLTERATATAKSIAALHGLGCDIEWTEEFEAVKNDNACVDLINTLAQQNGLAVTEVQQPFPWSEDFGVFTSKYKGALFGLGSGESQPQLHNQDFDFPDDIIPQGIAMFQYLVDYILNR